MKKIKTNDSIQLRVKTLGNFTGELPKYESAGASGMDVRAQLFEDAVLKPGERYLIPTRLIFSVPPGFELQVRPRSGWALKQGLTVLNTPGTIDSDYRGPVQILLINLGQETVVVKDQDRVAQLVLSPVVRVELKRVSELDRTGRDSSGFGSTGRTGDTGGPGRTGYTVGLGRFGEGFLVTDIDGNPVSFDSSGNMADDGYNNYE